MCHFLLWLNFHTRDKPTCIDVNPLSLKFDLNLHVTLYNCKCIYMISYHVNSKGFALLFTCYEMLKPLLFTWYEYRYIKKSLYSDSYLQYLLLVNFWNGLLIKSLCFLVLFTTKKVCEPTCLVTSFIKFAYR